MFRRVIADGEARPLGVVVFDILFNGLLEVILVAGLVQTELDVQFFLDPAVQRFVDGVVRRLSGSGHGADDVRVLDEIVVGHGGIHAALVRMQDNGVRASLQQVHHVRQAVHVLFPGTTSVRHLPRQDFLGEHVEVEGHLEVHVRALEGRHVRDDDLPWPVHRIPGRVDEIGIQVPDLPGPIVHLVLGLRLDGKIPVALVRVAVTDAHVHVDTDVGRRPAVTMRGMPFVDLPDHCNHFFALGVTRGRLPVLPFVVPRPAYAHQGANVLDGIVAGQQIHYLELFGFKRTYSRSPSSFVRTV